MIMTNPTNFPKRITDKITGEHITWTYKEVKIQLSLCLTNYAAYHEDVSGNGGIAPSALYGGEWWVSRHDRFTPEKRVTGTPLVRKSGGPGTNLNDVKRKTSAGNRTPAVHSPWPVTISTELSQLQNIYLYVIIIATLISNIFFCMDI
jgi:hypothetical protein